MGWAPITNLPNLRKSGPIYELVDLLVKVVVMHWNTQATQIKLKNTMHSHPPTLTLLLRVSTAGNFLTINLTADSRFLSTRKEGLAFGSPHACKEEEEKTEVVRRNKNISTYMQYFPLKQNGLFALCFSFSDMPFLVDRTC